MADSVSCQTNKPPAQGRWGQGLSPQIGPVRPKQSCHFDLRRVKLGNDPILCDTLSTGKPLGESILVVSMTRLAFIYVAKLDRDRVRELFRALLPLGFQISHIGKHDPPKKRAMIFDSVVLPAPLGPTKAIISPGEMSRLIPVSTCLSVPG